MCICADCGVPSCEQLNQVNFRISTIDIVQQMKVSNTNQSDWEEA